MRLPDRALPSLLLVVLLAIIAPGSPAGAQMPDPGRLPPRGVVAGDAAYLLLPPELVAAPTVEAVLFSPSGRYALIQSQSRRITEQSLRDTATSPREPPGETRLIGWDRRTREAREVWKAAAPATTVERIEWLPGADVALALIRESQGPLTRQAVLRITRSMAPAQVVLRTAPSDRGGLSLHVSPTRPLAILEYRLFTAPALPQPDGATRTITTPPPALAILDQNASLGTRVALPTGAIVQVIQWDPDGNPLLLLGHSPPNPGRERPQWAALSPRTGQTRPVGGRPPFYQPKPEAANEPALEPLLRVQLSPTVVKEAPDSPRLGLLWLESAARSEKPRALVCGDSTGGQLLPGESGVLYQSQGALWVAPLLKIDRAEYTALNTVTDTRARQALIQTRAMQIGLAVAQYAADHDETLPSGEEIQSALDPYLKQNGMLDGFNYTLGGGKLSTLQNPAETELGWIMGRAGRVVLYVDGHVTVRN